MFNANRLIRLPYQLENELHEYLNQLLILYQLYNLEWVKEVC